MDAIRAELEAIYENATRMREYRSLERISLELDRFIRLKFRANGLPLGSFIHTLEHCVCSCRTLIVTLDI